jgi:hypothetical protein
LYLRLPTIAGMTGTHINTPCLFPIEMRSHRFFCLVWPGTAVLQISASQVAKIIGVSHQCLA